MRAQAGDERRQGADDRHEAGDDDRLAAVLLVELVGVGQVLGLDQPEPLEVEEPRAQEVPDPVVHRVADDGRGDEETMSTVRSTASRGREGAGGEEQRVAGQERRHHQAGLAEDDQEQEKIGPGSVLSRMGLRCLSRCRKMSIRLGQRFHGSRRNRAGGAGSPKD
jgi:hypothetical protein